MTILEFAMQMEQDGEKHYRNLASSLEDTGLKTIFTMLADEEAEHFKIFQYLKDTTPVDVKKSTVLEKASNIFAAMKGSSGLPAVATIEQKEAYEMALDMEQKSISFYEEKVSASETAEEQKLLLAIAREERKHYRLIEGIIDFISRPEQWLEDAEYVQLSEY